MKGENILSVIVGVVIVVIFLSLFPSKCKMHGCKNAPYAGSEYCKEHDWSYYKSHNRSKTRSSTSSTNKTSSTTTTTTNTSTKSKKSSSSKKTTSSKKKSMPDCDDYDSYDDFMDDWDGCMPDGSDAEDYWENW